MHGDLELDAFVAKKILSWILIIMEQKCVDQTSPKPGNCNDAQEAR